VGQERELEAGDRGSGLDGMVFSARDNTIIFETNVEPFVQIEGLKSSSETKTDLVPLDGVDEPGVPLPSLGRSRRLNEDFVANQYTGALLRQTRDRKANKPINFSPHMRSESTDKWRCPRRSILAFGMSNFSRSRL